jgi:hypothetical protein
LSAKGNVAAVTVLERMANYRIHCFTSRCTGFPVEQPREAFDVRAIFSPSLLVGAGIGADNCW